MPRPTAGEYSPFHDGYISLALGTNAHEVLQDAYGPLQEFYQSIPEEKAGHSYGPGKWTVRQVLQHIIDTERILGYRALCIARGEQQSLPFFEENDYAANAPATNRSLASLVEEMLLVRKTIMLLFKSLTEEDLARIGNTNGQPLSANALAFITVGHAVHHQRILIERYLV